MKPYNAKAICPKCGNAKVLTRYCVDNWVSDKGTIKPHKDITVRKHLDRICQLCGYIWVEACLDDKD